MKTGSDVHELNYVTANRFYVEIEESCISACFSECSGLSVRVNYDRYSEGGVNHQQRIILGHTEFSEVTLKRGITNDLTFWGWAYQMLTRLEPDSHQQINLYRRNINILLFNQAGETMQCWTLIGAIPVGWQSSPLQADAETIAIEELTLAYEGIKVAVNLDPVRSGNTGGSIFHRDGRDFNAGGFFPSH